jgi:hypothetical protein
MQLFVTGVQLVNSTRRIYTVNDFESTDTVRSFKLVISNKFNIPTKWFYMLSGKKILKDTNTLAESSITNESNIQVIIRGGAGKPVKIHV